MDKGLVCDNLRLGKVLKDLRKDKGLTQEKVSKELEVSIQSINNWENKKLCLIWIICLSFLSITIWIS
ncbi:helix-turn-helix transcriptional regulator [Staphylococcus pseudintermedius]|nr:helix-turn-helix domain-containing protein [Staphylococcus pseudintermedius]EGQ1309473.1 helix-turn-helix domain-containing protein [Staphylococcus pseudintermedius]EGQ1606496.1 helix-turn-helix transcriptional regulator [Staphylococcus pseudintermedius]EGQ1652726.1 XRE family transcriptional regulator [Staphylococcus pseudintermedius]EGQ1698035.1 XRE family transcriptional regulator [Staphylococcus pseudintermedius]